MVAKGPSIKIHLNVGSPLGIWRGIKTFTKVLRATRSEADASISSKQNKPVAIANWKVPVNFIVILRSALFNDLLCPCLLIFVYVIWGPEPFGVYVGIIYVGATWIFEHSPKHLPQLQPPERSARPVPVRFHIQTMPRGGRKMPTSLTN